MPVSIQKGELQHPEKVARTRICVMILLHDPVNNGIPLLHLRKLRPSCSLVGICGITEIVLKSMTLFC